MDLELLESLALSDDRTAAIAQLLPGSTEHDYYRVLQAQHAGRLDEAQRIMDGWYERHGSYVDSTLHQRQLLYKLAANPADAATDVRDLYGASFDHEAEIDAVDPSRPTRLAGFSAQAFLEHALHYDLHQVTDEALYELIGTSLDERQRRALLTRLGHTPLRVVPLVHADLVAGTTFGALGIHDQLTLAQLAELAELRPALRGDARWVGAYVRRLRPPAWVDLELDRTARAAYLETVWAFVATLPPSTSSLKIHVAWHLLDTAHRLGREVPPAMLRAYLSLPRSASYVRSEWLRDIRSEHVGQLGTDFREVTGLPPTGDDEALVRALLFQRPDEVEQYAEWIDHKWLEQELATARLLAGSGDVEKATRILGPSRAAALRDRVELAWCAHNPTRFGLDDAIGLDVDVKNVAELTLKVFRIDPIAYFQHTRHEVGPDLDLDGLAASHEQLLRLDAPAVRRVRRRIELPMCARAGTYIIDLIGNGISSRAVIAKGRLRHVARVGAAGTVVAVLDDTGTVRTDRSVRAWIGDREYTPDERGTFTVPFSTAPGPTPMLLSCGDVASVASLDLVREDYRLQLDLLLDRQVLTAGRSAKAIARVALFVAEQPASVQLLKRSTWEVTLVDRAGVPTMRSQPLVLSDDKAALLEWPLGEDVASVSIAVRGTVDVISQQREQELSAHHELQVAEIHGTHAVETTYLAETSAGAVVSALGKTGEPRAQRPVTVALMHRWTNVSLSWELATDATGRVELGPIPGATKLSVTLGDDTRSWAFPDGETRGTYHVADGREVVIPLPLTRTAADAIRRMSIVELRANVPLRHVDADLVPLASGLLVRGLPPGDYALRAPGMRASIVVAPVLAEIGGSLVTPLAVLEAPRAVPVIKSVVADDGELRVEVLGAGARTTVHAIATRFASALTTPLQLGPARTPAFRADRVRPAAYLSGRELGDEYRYILERKHAKRFPSLLLDKPSLLLNPWSRRTTSTEVQTARAGGAFGAAHAMPASAPGYGGRGGVGGAVAGNEAAYASYDFLAAPPEVLCNLALVDGVATIPRPVGATSVTIVVSDAAGTSAARVTLPEPPLAPRDRRLELALDPQRHARQAKQIASLLAGERLVIDDLATAKVHLIDSLERAHAYLLALRDDAALREWAFLAKWHTLLDAEKREKYSKYACHELHLFLSLKDRPFFDVVVRPYLAHKRVKTFLDHYLLETDLAPFLERLDELNAVERALLAQRLPADDGLPRVLGDEVAIQAPDPQLDTRVIDALIDASALDGDDTIKAAKDVAYESQKAMMRSMGAGGPPPPPMASMAAPAPARKAAAKMKKERSRPSDRDDAESEMTADEPFAEDLARRREAAPMFRAADKTQEWAEHNWWQRTPSQSRGDMIPANRLWRALALHRGGPFLSKWLGLATGSFAEAMCALAVIDLPFAPGAHAIVATGNRLEIVAAGNALAGTSQLVDGELTASGPPLVVGQNYVRHDDRHDYVDGEQVDKYVTGPFAAGVVYTCQVVLANPSSSRQRIAALIQIPRGSLPVGGAKPTTTIDVALEAYQTHGHEYSFYVPFAGSCSHFPVHVSRGELIVAAAPATRLEVTSAGGAPDHRSWSYLSQHGSLADVLAFLATGNLAAIELERVAWRLRERSAYDAILTALEARRVYAQVLWAYALLHHDRARIPRWLRSLGGQLLGAGPVIDMFGFDSEDLGHYEHLEYAPLINARAHRLGAKLQILNDGLAQQWSRFLTLVAHRPRPTSEDLLAAAHYLFAMDRMDLALAMLGRVGEVTDRMQRDYVAAFAACLTGDPARARQLAEPWRDLPVDRWRTKFGALLAMLDELTGAAPAISDARSRDQQHGDLAAKQPAFDLALDRDGAIVRGQNVEALELRYFEMDVELLFSRQPFVQSDVSRFSFIEPGHREWLGALVAEQRIGWPAPLRGKNVVVEAVGAGMRKAKVHYANDLAIDLAHQYGQVRVRRADGGSLGSTYVKVYARKRGGQVAFYKDGYTDLRGWFDYASLSTTELDDVERFALLVCSDVAGSAILEANPPAR